MAAKALAFEACTQLGDDHSRFKRFNCDDPDTWSRELLFKFGTLYYADLPDDPFDSGTLEDETKTDDAGGGADGGGCNLC